MKKRNEKRGLTVLTSSTFPPQTMAVSKHWSLRTSSPLPPPLPWPRAYHHHQYIIRYHGARLPSSLLLRTFFSMLMLPITSHSGRAADCQFRPVTFLATKALLSVKANSSSLKLLLARSLKFAISSTAAVSSQHSLYWTYGDLPPKGGGPTIPVVTCGIVFRITYQNQPQELLFQLPILGKVLARPLTLTEWPFPHGRLCLKSECRTPFSIIVISQSCCQPNQPSTDDYLLL